MTSSLLHALQLVGLDQSGAEIGCFLSFISLVVNVDYSSFAGKRALPLFVSFTKKAFLLTFFVLICDLSSFIYSADAVANSALL